jgi:hypothetical protein
LHGDDDEDEQEQDDDLDDEDVRMFVARHVSIFKAMKAAVNASSTKMVEKLIDDVGADIKDAVMFASIAKGDDGIMKMLLKRVEGVWSHDDYARLIRHMRLYVQSGKRRLKDLKENVHERQEEEEEMEYQESE